MGRSLRLCLLLVAWTGSVHAQVPADSSSSRATGSLPVPRAAPAEGGLEQPIQYVARDSIQVVLGRRDSLEGDVVSLFGEVQALYEGATVTAGRVDYESTAEILRASPQSSDSGSVGVPSFSGEEGQFSGRSVVYNLRTQRGRVTGARTQIEDGFLLGGILKQQNERVVFAQNAAYTTCELDHPHYALEAGRIKVVDGERVYTGPVRLKLLGIPLPLVLPFGYFPAAEGRRSGPLAVGYGQESGFGLHLENLGWYFAISDFLDAQVAGKVGTEGSFQLNTLLRYNRRYAYSGNVALSYARLRSGEATDPTFGVRTPVGLRWSHNQTFPAGQRLTASVNLQSASQRLVANDVEEQIASSTSSSVTFAQQWPTAGRSLNVSAQVFQDFANNRTSATLPQVAFSQRRLFPFRRGRSDKWYETISLEYSANAQNAFEYAPLEDETGISALDALFSP
ncbi:putative LPS assembly protein LptD, partial [Rubrivirga sp.]|uniref:putative LPS assembly protein LptD n=1 Tax=Rubrivirga sp. TaxID=1885344 RepID=UPI003C7608F6